MSNQLTNTEIAQVKEDWGLPFPEGELLEAKVKNIWDESRNKLFPEAAYPIYKTYLGTYLFNQADAYKYTIREWRLMKKEATMASANRQAATESRLAQRAKWIAEKQANRNQYSEGMATAERFEKMTAHKYGGKSRKNRKQKRKQTLRRK